MNKIEESAAESKTCQFKLPGVLSKLVAAGFSKEENVIRFRAVQQETIHLIPRAGKMHSTSAVTRKDALFGVFVLYNKKLLIKGPGKPSNASLDFALKLNSNCAADSRTSLLSVHTTSAILFPYFTVQEICLY